MGTWNKIGNINKQDYNDLSRASLPERSSSLMTFTTGMTKKRRTTNKADDVSDCSDTCTREIFRIVLMDSVSGTFHQNGAMDPGNKLVIRKFASFYTVPTGMMSLSGSIGMGTAGMFPHSKNSAAFTSTAAKHVKRWNIEMAVLFLEDDAWDFISHLLLEQGNMLRGPGNDTCKITPSGTHMFNKVLWVVCTNLPASENKPNQKITWCTTLFWLLRFIPTLTLFEEKANVYFYWVHEVFQRFIWRIFKWFLWCERMLPKPFQPTVGCSVPFNIGTVK